METLVVGGPIAMWVVVMLAAALAPWVVGADRSSAPAARPRPWPGRGPDDDAERRAA